MKKCPSCKIINPYEAERCDCGYSFETGLINEKYTELNLKNKPIIPTIFTILLVVVIGCLLCIYYHFGFFKYYWYYFKGVPGIFILWIISVVSVIIAVIPVIISWIIFFKNKRVKHSKEIKQQQASKQ